MDGGAAFGASLALTAAARGDGEGLGGVGVADTAGTGLHGVQIYYTII